jgi:glycogen synthase
MHAELAEVELIVPRCAGYAYEVQTALGGWGMEFILGSRQYALNGVLNGIDYAEWDPASDKRLPANYSVKDLPELQGKKVCKRELQKELRLPENDEVPLVAFIGRLDSQKGADLILGASQWIVEQVLCCPIDALHTALLQPPCPGLRVASTRCISLLQGPLSARPASSAACAPRSLQRSRQSCMLRC